MICTFVFILSNISDVGVVQWGVDKGYPSSPLSHICPDNLELNLDVLEEDYAERFCLIPPGISNMEDWMFTWTSYEILSNTIK